MDATSGALFVSGVSTLWIYGDGAQHWNFGGCAEHRRSYSSRKSERSDHFGESHFSGARHPPNVPRPAQEPSFPSSSQSLGLEVPTLFAHFFSRCDAGRPSHRRWLLGAALSLAAAARGRCADGLALHHRQRARCCVDFELPPTIPCRTPGGLGTQHPSLAPLALLDPAVLTGSPCAPQVGRAMT